MPQKHSTDNPSPLRKYLDGHGITTSEFARILSASRGWSAGQSLISRWAISGPLRPGIERDLAIATGGEVTPVDWARWRRSRARAVRS